MADKSFVENQKTYAVGVPYHPVSVNPQNTSHCVITKEESLCYLDTSDDLPFYECVLTTTHCEP